MRRLALAAALMLGAVTVTGCGDGCGDGRRYVSDPPLWLPVYHPGICSGGYGTCTPGYTSLQWVPQGHCETIPTAPGTPNEPTP